MMATIKQKTGNKSRPMGYSHTESNMQGLQRCD